MSRNRLFENKLFFEQKGYFVELNQNKRKKVAQGRFQVCLKDIQVHRRSCVSPSSLRFGLCSVSQESDSFLFHRVKKRGEAYHLPRAFAPCIGLRVSSEGRTCSCIGQFVSIRLFLLLLIDQPMGWNLVLPSIHLSFKLSYICEFYLYEGEVVALAPCCFSYPTHQPFMELPDQEKKIPRYLS